MQKSRREDSSPRARRGTGSRSGSPAMTAAPGAPPAPPPQCHFPAVAAAPGGAVWCAYVAHNRGTPLKDAEVEAGRFESLVPSGNGDQIRLTRYDGRAWSAPLDVTAAGLDVWRPAVAADGRGRVWVVWSQGVRGNWDLYARKIGRAHV